MRKEILTMVATPNFVNVKGSDVMKARLQVTDENVTETKINTILAEHDIDGCGVLEICRKCGFDDADILEALQTCEYTLDKFHYETDSYYIACMSLDEEIARIDSDRGGFYVTQKISDMLDGVRKFYTTNDINDIKDLAVFCNYYNIDINNYAGIYDVNER